MAPAQNMNITREVNDKYTHKKFQGKQVYAHKKFGTCISATPPKMPHRVEANAITEEQMPAKSVPQSNSATSNRRSHHDIFRPYALPDEKPRKRKHHELRRDENSEQLEMEFKRFAYSSPVSLSPSLPPLPAFPTVNTHFVNSAMMVNPFYSFQQYQFNPQTFAILLRKQSEALYMGEIVKRQANLNLYNLMEQK